VNQLDSLHMRAKAHHVRLFNIDQARTAVHGSGVLGRINKKAAIGITFGLGSMWAFYALIAWQLGWIAWQSSGHVLLIRDPYPFGFCLFLSNLIQLWALPAIMVGQNVLAEAANQRAAADHETLDILHQINVTQLDILREVRGFVARR
jgi:uncharacterized membrane protein